MIRVRLYVRGGGFVAEKVCLPFQLMPEIMAWGSRLFVRDLFKDTTDSYGYTEACAFVLDVMEAQCSTEPQSVGMGEPPYKEYGRGPTF